MIQLFKNLLGMGESDDLKAIVAEAGTVILDVRSKEEYNSGHIQGSINMPLQVLNATTMAKLKKDKAIITCCASGMRSASAKSILTSNGFTRVYNGGGWASLQHKLNK